MNEKKNSKLNATGERKEKKFITEKNLSRMNGGKNENCVAREILSHFTL